MADIARIIRWTWVLVGPYDNWLDWYREVYSFTGRIK